MSDEEELVPVCPSCGAEDQISEENEVLIDIEVTSFHRVKGKIRPDSYGSWITEFSEPESTGRYACGGCGDYFDNLDVFFEEASDE